MSLFFHFLEKERKMIDIDLEIDKIKRKFIPGDTWLYFRIFTGIKTADRILRELLHPVKDFLLEKKLIEKWFFIRYRDPHNQLRVRFNLKRSKNLDKIIKIFNDNFRSFIVNDFIWKIQTDTYVRELERYGFENIELSESIFFYDSEMILKFFLFAGGDEHEQLRWMFGLKAIDRFLSDFNLNMNSKLDLVTILRNGFGKEFGEDKYLRKQLEKKFRSNRVLLTDLLSVEKENNEINKQLNKIISLRSAGIRKTVEQIISLEESNKLNLNFYDLMGSYLHMTVNRLFRTNQRLHELVLYDFLKRYYISEIARKKYN